MYQQQAQATPSRGPHMRRQTAPKEGTMVREASAGACQYWDFSRDQAMPGGMPEDLQAGKLAQGWRVIQFTHHRLVKAQFRRQGEGAE